MIFRARQFTYAFPRTPLLMGIVNVTPDSFSDGGKFLDPAAALAHARQLVAEGADILDIGGESTRPGATPVTEAEELARVLPVITALAKEVSIPLSIDTMKPAVAAAAIAAGASIINDVAAHRPDDAMARVAAETGAGYIAMHMQGTPATMQANPAYTDIVAEINAFFQDRMERLRTAGVETEKIVLDVGIGFGKTPAHNLELLRCLRNFAKWRRPLLLGASRKSFLEPNAGGPAADRLAGSLACAVWATQLGVSILRVHDVAATRQAVRTTETLLAGKIRPEFGH